MKTASLRRSNLPVRIQMSCTLAVGISMAGATISGNAQAQVTVANSLTHVSGMNEAEASLAAAIHVTCPSLSASYNQSPSNLTTQQTYLLYACRDMVQTANAQQGATAGVTYNMGINEEDLRTALGELAGEEVLTHGRTTRERAQTQRDAVLTRLTALRQGGVGHAGGVSWLFDTPDGRTAASTLTDDIARGGSAGADGDDKKRSWYVNGGTNFGRKTATSREDGYDFNSYGVTAGADRRLSADAIAGGALGYSKLKGDVSTGADSADSDGWSLSAYGTRYSDDWHLDGVLSAGRTRYDTARDQSALASALNTFESGAGRSAFLGGNVTGHTTGQHIALTVGAGRDFHSGSLAFSPYGRASYLKAKIDGYAESGDTGIELEVGEQKPDSLEGVLGFNVSTAASTGFGVVQQQLTVEYHHQFKTDSYEVKSNYLYDPLKASFVAPTDALDPHYFVIGAGVTAAFANGKQAFAYYETTVGMQNLTSNTIVVGLRGEF